jgi:hypothetical protein
MGHDHGHDAEIFYLGLALDEENVESSSKGAWRGSARTTRTRRRSCGASGRRATTGGSSWRC